MQERKKEYHERHTDEILQKKRICYQKRKTKSETKKNTFEYPQEANDQPTGEIIAPEALVEKNQKNLFIFLRLTMRLASKAPLTLGKSRAI